MQRLTPRHCQTLSAILVALVIGVAGLATAGRATTKWARLGADLLLINGTVERIDAAISTAQAVAVKAGKTVAVGFNYAIHKLRGRNPKVVDLTDRKFKRLCQRLGSVTWPPSAPPATGASWAAPSC